LHWSWKVLPWGHRKTLIDDGEIKTGDGLRKGFQEAGFAVDLVRSGWKWHAPGHD
jgi:hypothetical protein